MSTNATISIEISSDLAKKLDQLSRDTGRSKTALAAEALTAYLDREIEIIAGIREGLADFEAGRTVSHEEAMAEIDAAIEAASRSSR